jgi:hypothetical protein
MRIRLFVFASLMFALSSALQAAWLPVASSSFAAQPPSVEIRGLSPDMWEISVTVPGFMRESYADGEQNFDLFSLPDEGVVGNEGEVNLPVVSRWIALRNTGDPTLQIVSEEWEDLDGQFTLAPVKEGENAEARAEEYAMRDSYLPNAAAIITPKQILGGVSLAEVQIHTAKYNPVQQRVRVLRSIQVQVVESGGPLTYDHPITETNASILRAIVPNWDELNLDEMVVRGTLLYILANNTDVQTTVQPLIQWRKRKGYTVEIAGPTQIGSMTTNSVKTYIQGRYNNANPPLEFVCLVGDANGSFTVPYYTYGGGPGDYDYTRLDGTDLLPDIAIGRLCFNTTTELNGILVKILNYERDPISPSGATKPNWYKGGGLFVGSGSGISPVQILRTVRARMLDAGYTSSSIDTIYYINESVNSTKIETSINSGVSFWCYRGWLGMSGYEGSDLSGLTNGRRMPFIMNLTCGTNDYSGDDITERFVRVASKGAIAAVGMSTVSTHTRFNNSLMAGGAQGLLRENIHTTGGSLVRAKVELYHDYPLDSTNVNFYSGITTLIGDPAIDVFTNTPETLYVNNPASAPIGTNTLTLTVTNQNALPVADAYVNLVKGTEVFIGDWTNASGQVTLNFYTSVAETLFVTTSKHNCRPAINYTLITTSTRQISPASSVFVIDDDNAGSSIGDANGKANPSETIEFALPLKNWGTTTATGVVATLSETDPYVTISDNSETYGTIAAGATVSPPDDFDFTVAAFAPDGYVVQFTLSASDNLATTWISAVPITLSNGNLEYVSYSLTGAGNGILDPSETGQLSLTLTNAGTRATAAGTVGNLQCSHSGISITDNDGSFTAASIGGTCNNSGNTYTISASSSAFPGERISFIVIFPLANGFVDTVNFNLTIGSVASTAPTPPDEYGYWAFDDTDVSFAKRPTYSWFEIDPDYGGAGTAIAITDNADEADATAVVNLPFTFTYYGQNYTQIAVCSNGWLAMGAEEVVHTDFRNYTISSAIGADAMIAPFWDDLRVPPAAVSSLNGNTGQEQTERGGDNLDQGNDVCPATVIPSIPYTDSGTTAGQANNYSGTCVGNSAADVIYSWTPTVSESNVISLCGSSYDTGLIIKTGGACPGTTEVGCNDDYSGCGLGSQLTITVTAGVTYYIIVDGYSSSSGSYALSVDHPAPPAPGAAYAYHDAANHRFIIEWSHCTKYNGSTNPSETFQCILKEPGYPATPTGDSEILFQYARVTNAVDVSTSNSYCTVGIENPTQTDGVLYSYYNMVSPSIPGAAAIDSGRAVLFTTQKFTAANPKAPTKLVAMRSGNDIRLVWNAVRQDINDNPISVTGYNVHRGTVSTFTPDVTNVIGSIADTTYLDVGVIGTDKYFYAITAYLNVSTTDGNDNDHSSALPAYSRRSQIVPVGNER